MLDLATVRLTWETPYHGPAAPQLLRGAIADRFRDNSLFHQHEQDRVVYRYPRIHYRWDCDGALVVGFGAGVQSLLELPWPGLTLALGEQPLTVLEATCSLSRHNIQPTDRLFRYRFAQPWLPFNQQNYQRYQAMFPPELAGERDRLAVAGLLIALRGLGIDFPGRLFAAFELHHAQPRRYKAVQMLGFWGTLLANVDLPNGFAFGRAVSHGYGWLIRSDSRSRSQENR